MITPDIASLYPLLCHYFWPMLRILALFMASPVFNEKQINRKLKIGMAMLISLLIAPGLPDSGVSIFSLEGVLVSLQQLIIGVAIGLTMQLAFVTVRTAGEIIGLQMGLSFATFFDPSGGQNMPVIARILNLLVTLLFLTLNGHLWLLNVLVDSFNTLPISPSLPGSNGFFYFAQSAGIIFRSGLMLGLPIVTLLLCLNLTLGLINRLTPQLSIFVIGFPLTLTVGMFALSMMMYSLAPYFENLLAQLLDQAVRMLAIMGG
ncbi:flagellar biosynthesis protein FliR [Erwinia typographi]|uniref:Flagellar biosynthetic protein FliR n=1 Tax=Erwinia typographi TaxID=371042 RepID=A0A0A3Z6G1_9GAMM|nr:flagellar biosynthetic protein FliR [Erwinia typographi]KGT93349.1 flagellar biosynthesis protein FliR [Erwinia typographi]